MRGGWRLKLIYNPQGCIKDFWLEVGEGGYKKIFKNASKSKSLLTSGNISGLRCHYKSEEQN